MIERSEHMEGRCLIERSGASTVVVKVRFS